MERGSRKISSSAGNEKMERDGDRQKEIEGHFSTGQSPQWAVVPMEEEKEEEEEDIYRYEITTLNIHNTSEQNNSNYSLCISFN